jgi:ADP-ribose pyrophosphatase YjhB (NUDIX family)
VTGVNRPLLSAAEWYASLPTCYLSAGMLITDQQDRVLLVKPNYRDGWAIPGGLVEANEAPHTGAVREVTEELGLHIEAGELLVMDWLPAQGERPRALVNYVFDGGSLATPDQIVLQESELDDYGFWSWEEAEARMPASSAARIPAARRARQQRRAVYLRQ